MNWIIVFILEVTKKPDELMPPPLPPLARGQKNNEGINQRFYCVSKYSDKTLYGSENGTEWVLLFYICQLTIMRAFLE